MIFWKKKKKYKVLELNPEEVLLDAYNLPSFDTQQFEGRVQKPIRKKTIRTVFGIALFIMVIFGTRLGYIQLAQGEYFSSKSDLNSLDHIPVFAERGIIYDRNGIELAWNNNSEVDAAGRAYIDTPGFANLLGYVSYPTRDKSGKFWQTRTEGRDGVEKELDVALAGKNGVKLIETNVRGEILSENTIEQPEKGKNIYVTVDAAMQERLYKGIADLAKQSEYKGGAGAIMDITNGELLAITSYPEFDPEVLSSGENTALISEYMKSSAKPFLNRVIDGVYTPGSIVKPFLALGALQEGIISPEKTIVSTGKLVIPNPYNPKLESVFKDNKAHGAVDMRHAIAVSSNVYFYEVGGGYQQQQGLGIANIEKYTRMFGIGEKTGIDIRGEREGNIPSVAWKAKRFPGDPWRVGDTYNTSIGQYGFQVTPIQMLRAVAGIASRGKLVTPHIEKDAKELEKTEALSIYDGAYTVVQEAMRLCVTDGTCTALNIPGLSVAAKSGTAQINNNTRVNSWAIGFYPTEAPKYAFVVLMENGPLVSSGATHAIRPLLQWIAQGRPEPLPELPNTL